jgi:hypothetical protein
MPKGISIHIGLNRIDPKHYGWDGKLDGCLNDAKDMMALAKERGFQASTLLDEQATAERAIEAIGKAAQNLRAGDILFLTYSGHGGQVADTNGDDEDKRDETWCLYDRQLVDDELYGLWSRFEPGTRVLVLSDSCHSGSVVKLIRQFSRIVSDPELTEPFGIPTAPGARGGPPGEGRGRSAENVPVDDVAALKGTRRMPPSVEQATEERNKKLYREIQEQSPDGDRAAVGATVLLISGCQDAQLSSDGKKNGLFTHTLKTVWKEGKFKGAYRSFHKQIQENMPVYQQPNFYVVGMPNPTFLRQVPFMV